MSSNIQREVLPIPDKKPAGAPAYDAKDPEATYDPIEPIRPPEGAPNILVVLLDDAGFGSNSAFGGPCRTPTFDRLAAGGLRYNRFHTTAVCSPTRLSLLTGRNPHAVGMGLVTDMATAAPGYTSMRPNTAATFAEVLRLNGYSTSQFGKSHEVPTWEYSPMGPFDRWPTGGGGFEYFYGFINGETSQFYPGLYEGTISVDPPGRPEDGYHLTDDIATRATRWLGMQHSLMPDKPFLLYFAPGATHAPHHVPEDWLDRYKGEFDQGWDVLREQIFARQKELGVIPESAELTPRHDDIPAWDDISPDMKPVLTRQMEVYAAFLEHTDYHIGRVVDAIEQLGQLDNTLIMVITGDNGASAEGSLQGTWNETLTMTGMAGIESPEFLQEHLHEWGTPASYPHFAVGWAHALDTPYQYTKQVASHWGGTRNGLIVHWPDGIEGRGEIRQQFHHVNDIAPTVLEVSGLPHPTMVHGVAQQPVDGVSMLYSFNDADAPERHETQYFEIAGNRGIYHKGWTAVAKHSTPWQAEPSGDFDDDVWELYDTTTDWSQAHDLAEEQPERLEEMKRLFLIEAARNNVLPLDDRPERADPDTAGRPVLASGDRQLLYGSMGRLHAFAVLNLRNKSHSITAEVTVPPEGADGVIVSRGGRMGGWAVYAKEGRPKYCYNFYGIDLFHVDGSDTIPEGTHQVRAEFSYDGGGTAKGGTIRLLIDGKQVGEGRVERTQPLPFASDEPLCIGHDDGSRVTTDYDVHNFSGDVAWVELRVAEDGVDEDHLITPEERMQVALTVE